MDGRTIRTISTMMRFDTAVDVTVSELRVELMFPVDDESEAYFRQTAAHQVRIRAGLSDNSPVQDANASRM